MKKPLFLLLSLISSAWGLLSAQPRTEADALNIAKQFLQDKYAVGQEGIRRVAPLKSVIQRAPVNKNIDSWNPFYIWNDEASNSFVIVSGDARMPSILGYAPNLFDEEKIPDALSELLSDYAAQFNVLQEQPLASSLSDTQVVSDESSEIVLETASWGQGKPFNEDCPKNSAAGCVATAMSIIMRYHSWPLQGEGAHEYTWYSDGYPVSLSANFGNTVYDWKNMPLVYDDYTEEQGEAVARLMYHAGVSVDMYYGYSASGASVENVKNALSGYFRYNPLMTYIKADNYTQDVWLSRLKTEIDGGRPVLYAGTSVKTNTGHAFVVDGYQGDLLHINWGWNGYYNGFFALGYLTPNDGMGGYNSEQSAIVNIKPYYVEEPISPVVLVSQEGFCSVTMDCRDVKKNVDFNFMIIAYADYPFEESYTGDYQVALVDSAGNIKEIVGQHVLYHNGSAIGISCKSSQDAVLGDSLALFTQKTGTNELLPVFMETGKLARVSAVGNEPPTANLIWDDPDKLLYHAWAQSGNFEGQLIQGAYMFLRLNLPEGCYCKVETSDGKVIFMDTDFGSISWVKDNMVIKLSLIDMNNRTENLKFKLEKPGMLEQVVTESGTNLDLVKTLTLSGKMDARDFSWLHNYKLLEGIDLSQVEVVAFEGNPAHQIPDNSFDEFSMLKSFEMPIQLKSIGNNAFRLTGLERITIPAMVNLIGLNAFWGSPYLKDVTVKNPEPVMISWCVFTGTKREEGTLHVPQGSLSTYRNTSEWNQFQNIVDDVPNEILSFCVDGIYYETIPGYEKSKYVRVVAPPEGSFYSGSLTIPESVNYDGVAYVVCEIESKAFYNSENLLSLFMSDSIQVIGVSAFENCISLQHLRLSDSIEVIPEFALAYLPALYELNLPKNLIRIDDYGIYNNQVESLYIPMNLSYLGSGVLTQMYKLRKVVVDSENEYFTVEDGLLLSKDRTKLILRPEGLQTDELMIPDGVTLVGTSSILGTGLKRIVIPETVIRFEPYSIVCDYGLTEIYALSSIPPFADENAFGSWCTDNTVLKVPVGAKTAYEQAIGWSNFKKIEETSETSVNLPEANVAKIKYTSDGLYIWADSPVDYALYALNGTLLKQGRLQKGSNKILPSSRMGLILKVGNQTYKIINRD